MYDAVSSTPLLGAILHGDHALMKRLLDLGASPTMNVFRFQSCYNVLHQTGDTEAIDILLNYGVEVDGPCEYCPTALWKSVQTENHDRILHLASQGADVNSPNFEGENPLQYARRFHMDDIAELLERLGGIEANEKARRAAQISSVLRITSQFKLYLDNIFFFSRFNDFKTHIMSKLIVVVGATGTQGGSVVDTFLQEPGWKVRALTRNANSAAAKKLRDKGVHEIVSASLDNVSSLVQAFHGAHAIFAVTDFWGPYYDPETTPQATAAGVPKNVWAARREEQQGRNVFDAAAQVQGLQRLIFSSLSNATKWSGGKYTHVYHFDSKAHAAEYGQARYPELWKKTSIIQVGFYLSNVLTYPFMRPQKDADGVYTFSFTGSTNGKLPFVAAEEDTGPFTRALVATPEAGKNLIAYRAWMSMDEYIAILSQTLGVKTKTRVLSPEGASSVLSTLPEDLLEELVENANYFAEFGYEGRDDPSLVHPKDLGIEVKLPSVEDWVKKQDWSAIFS
ncbi:hypothetical protein CLAIMM_04087 [Cladophialophora immunda]|nr:hypothetical protein CLAIMM_04087 [Cladophialophora immunda]